MRNMMKWTIVVVLGACGFVGAVSAENGMWWWSVGPAYRGDMELTVKGSSYVQQNGLHAARGSYNSPLGQGAEPIYTDRVYDDGFVALDPGTIESGDGLTWYWGYTRPDQYNAAADTLTFRRGGGSRVSVTTTLNGRLDDTDRLEAWAVEFTGGGRLTQRGQMSIGVQAGLGFLWNIDSRMSGRTYAETITEQRLAVVDVYQLDGVVPPAPPYSGTYEGPGPLIPNRPSARSEVVTGGTTWRAENEVRIDLDAAVQQLWAGPRFEWEAGKGMQVFCVPFVSLSRLEARYERNEWFCGIRADGAKTTLASWHNRTTDEQLLLGLGVRAGARVTLSGPWFLDVAAGYEAVESAETTLGPNTANLDLSGYTVLAQVGREF